ncbi:MAG: response regulator, partial [Gemmatimonadetes bacterium]
MGTHDFGKALRRIAHALPDGSPLILLRARGPDARVTAFAGDPESLTGYTLADFRERPGLWREIVHPDDLEVTPTAIAELRSGATGEVTYRIRMRDGEERQVRERFRLLPGEAGAACTLEDVTSERRMAERLASIESRMWHSQRMEALGTLAGGIAHDFNNLLTALLTTAQLVAQEESLSRQAKEDLLVIQGAANRGAALVRQILDFAARESESRVGPADLGRVARDLGGILERTLGEDIELELDIDEEVWPLYCDAAQVEQVLLNLVFNAREAMKRGGRLRVAVRNETVEGELGAEGDVIAPGRYVRLTVADTGPGIPLHVRESIFNPYVSTKGSTGSGFGLATVRRIARGYGGAVRLKTAPGQGACFDVYLPVRPADRRAPAVVRAANGDAPAAGGLRLLLVEDDPQVRETLERELRAEGHSVVSVGTAGEAQAAFDSARPRIEAVVIDMMLPDRDGWELYRALSRRATGLPVVFVSGYAPEALGFEGGGLPGAFLRKPLEPGSVAAAVRAAAPPSLG